MQSETKTLACMWITLLIMLVTLIGSLRACDHYEKQNVKIKDACIDHKIKEKYCQSIFNIKDNNETVISVSELQIQQVKKPKHHKARKGLSN